MTASTMGAENFPLDEAREIVRDLHDPKPFVYWADFLLFGALGWTAFVAAVGAAPFSGAQAGLVLVASLALYRAVIFTHELAHLKKGSFGFFRLVWNLAAGCPLLIPSFLYHGVHNDHHKRDLYGTTEDGEYLPFGVGPPRDIVAYMALIFVLPLLFVGRFLVLAPLSLVSPKVRAFAWERASSLTIDLAYRRPPAPQADVFNWRLQEACASAYGLVVVALVASGILPLAVLLIWYATAVLVFLFNSLRTLAAHAYRYPGDVSVSVAEQYLDSVNVPGNDLISPLWAPVGLRYHATHHLFPAMPYHNLGAAHRRLMADLPDNSAYAETLRDSLWDALTRLWLEAAAKG